MTADGLREEATVEAQAMRDELATHDAEEARLLAGVYRMVCSAAKHDGEELERRLEAAKRGLVQLAQRDRWENRMHAAIGPESFGVSL